MDNLPSDEDIILASWEGKDEARAQLLMKHAGALQVAIRRAYPIFDEHEAEDVVSEGIRRFWEVRERCDDKRDLCGFVYGFVKNVAREHAGCSLNWQKTRSLEVPVEAALVGNFPSPKLEDDLDKVENDNTGILKAIKKVLDRMNPILREEKNLSRCVIRANGLRLYGFDLSNARLSGDMVLNGARITNTYFGPGFHFDNLRRTLDVQRGRFPCQYFPEGDCDMSGLVLTGARIDAHGTRCTSINLTDTDIDNCTMVFTEMGSKIVARAVSSTRNYERGVFSRTTFVRADFSNFKFDRTLLIYSLPGSGSDLTNATFHDAVIHPVTPQISLTADQIMQTWNYKHNRLGQLREDLQAEIDQLEQQGGVVKH